MGFVHVQVGISSPERPEREELVRLLVDTGAILSVIPRAVLEHLGVRPTGKRNVRGFGGSLSRETGGVQMRYNGTVANVTVVFGEADDPVVMGVTALESLGYEVDPVTGQIKPTEMLLLGMRQ
jgi:predicted aspartyl protease